MKALIVATALLLTSCHPAVAATFGHWDSDPANELIQTVEKHEDGSMSQAIIYLERVSAIITYPPAWNSSDTHHEPLTKTTIIKVSGKAVKFKLERFKDGAVYMEPITYAGKNHMTTQFWTKSRVYFEFENGFVGYFSAKGVQAAWAHLNNNLAL